MVGYCAPIALIEGLEPYVPQMRLVRVPGATQESFAAAAAEAKDGCPISRALKGNVEMTVEATLEG